MATSEIVYYRLHGEQDGIILDNSNHTRFDVSLLDKVPDGTFNNCKLVVYGACSVASTADGPRNMLNATEDAGVITVVGFEQVVNCDSANTFMTAFFIALSQGKTVNSALYDAKERTQEEHGTADTTKYYDVAGDGTLSFD